MRRAILSLAGLFLTTLPVYAQQDDMSKVEIKVTKVTDHVYMLAGRGGNMGVSVGDDGIILIDDEFAPLVPRIVDALKSISDKPLKYVLNTHWHRDHTGGNLSLSELATLVAHDNVRKRLMEGSKVPDRAVEPAPGGALPIITFSDSLTLHINGEDVRALHFPHGHTDGDSVIFFTGSNVVHTGDDFVTYGFPFVDFTSGGSVTGLIDNVTKLVAQLPADVKIIPGHGELSTLDDMKKFLQMLKETYAIVETGVKKGKTLEQLQKEKVLAKYAKWDGGFIKADGYIEAIYTDIQNQKASRKGKK